MDHKIHMETPELLEKMLIKITQNESNRSTQKKAKVMLGHLQQRH